MILGKQFCWLVVRNISSTQFHVGKEGVKVFQQNSRGDNFMLDVTEGAKLSDLKEVANKLLGKIVFVAWPHLQEAKVTTSTVILLCFILVLVKLSSFTW